MVSQIKKPLIELLLRKRALLFDLDGTLVDSSSCHEDAFKYAMQQHAPHLLPGFVYERVKGLRTDDVFRSLQVTDYSLIKQLTGEKQASYRQRVRAGEVKAFPRVKELLSLLKQRGYRLAVVTSASRGSATSILENLDLMQFFQTVVTGEDVANAKPAPDGYLAGIEQMQIAKDIALVVEDAISGVEAGKAAGLEVIAVNNPELQDTDEYFGTIADLHEALRTKVKP